MNRYLIHDIDSRSMELAKMRAVEHIGPMGRIGWRLIKGIKVWFGLTKAGYWRKLSPKQVESMDLQRFL